MPWLFTIEWRTQSVKHMAYRERYRFEDLAGRVAESDFVYNARGKVTTIAAAPVPTAGSGLSDEIAQRLRALVASHG